MPIYNYQCNQCSNIQEQYRSVSEIDDLGEVVSDIVCQNCSARKAMVRTLSTNIQIIDPSAIRLNGDPKKEAEYRKRAKDPERARQMRKKEFGSDGISITKSPEFHKEKRVKAQGKSDVDRTEFIKAAAQNPNALQAAKDALAKNGKKV